eukprot:TRINITY_DN1878_c0_g1_i1.p1 TRINITY_DN1878_c0_g1~~TRINITY_DN1878_c0_g1_i1.p1  ORF type:complete len:646 (+),score=284.41 TRINITY_DN1878_c0_g1_i1:996-2933(+)
MFSFRNATFRGILKYTQVRNMASSSAAEVQAFIDKMNTDYDKLHKSFEDNFWATKMYLKGNSGDELTRTKNVYESFLRDKDNLNAVREHMKSPNASDEHKRILKCMERTFLCYLMESEEASKMKEHLTSLESDLEMARNAMKLGYTDPKTNEFKEASSVLIRTLMSTNDDEATRKACYEGMRAIGPFVAERFCEIAKLRNKISRANGYEDYYAYKIQTAEGFDKKRLFEILDDLEQSTRPILEKARAKLAAEYGESALEPWNLRYKIAGDVIKETDPYFPFTEAVSAWARSFAAMGIEYKQSVMNLDLCDREKKYSNGFCHWPQCPYVKSDGTFIPCVTNFTSLAVPSAVGSGNTALATLMHEGGHAAAFANIYQPSPFFAQERPPMSVAYAETQSMFLDSLVSDAAWLGRYATSVEGKVMPWDLIQKKLELTHDYRVFAVRSMLIVPYFEKALYELPEEEVTSENIQRIADEIDVKLFGGMVARPCLSVPHILADESSCYYQGYVLAEMAVFQTRNHFLKKYGNIVDNKNIGKDLAEVYWKCGNSENFLDVVQKMTGKPLLAEDMVNDLKEDLAELLVKEKKDYEEAVKAGPTYTTEDVTALLNMRMRLVHGDEVIADTQDMSFFDACKKYKDWIAVTFPKEEQ